MGLLDNLDDPKTQALLSLGLGLLNSRGNFGQGVGQAGTQALGVYSDARKMQQQKAFQDQQIALMQAQTANVAQQDALRKQQEQREAQKQAMLAKLMGGGGMSGGTMSPTDAIAANGGRFTGANPALIGQPKGGGTMLSQMNEDQIVAALMAGVPDKAYDAWKFSKVGEQVQPGTFTRLPNGQRTYNEDVKTGIGYSDQRGMFTLPNAAETLSGLAGASAGATTAAQEEAKAPYSFVDTYSDGKPGKVPLSTLVPQKPAGRQSMQIPPAAQQAANADALKMIDAEIANTPPGPALDALKRERGRLAMTGSPSGVPGNAASAPAGFVQTGPSTTDKAASGANEDINKNWLTTSYAPVIEAGSTARNMLTNIGVARSGLALAGPTGWGKEATVAAARVLGALGVDKADQMATGAQMFQQAASTRLWDVLNAAKGVQSKDDAIRAQETFVKLGNTPKANAFILDLAQATAERDARRAAWYRDALPLGQKAGDLQMLDRKWQEREPSIWQMPSMQKWGK